MSNYTAPTFHPVTGEIENAEWIDDYFATHHYGVRFPGNETVFDPCEYPCEQVGAKAMSEIERLELRLSHIADALLTGTNDHDPLSAAVCNWFNTCQTKDENIERLRAVNTELVSALKATLYDFPDRPGNALAKDRVRKVLENA